MLGMDFRQFAQTVQRTPRFLRDMRRYSELAKGSSFTIRLSSLYPILSDAGPEAAAGKSTGHYFQQDLWAARKVFATRPDRHLDIGSRIDGFIAHLLTFMPVTVVDIRPLESEVTGLTFIESDATRMTNIGSGSCPSVSSLHAVEHFGLGRYGDPIDPGAWRDAVNELARVLAPGGRLYFSVPIGREQVWYNAHRVFAPSTILGAFSALKLVSFSAIGDDGCLHEDCEPSTYADSRFACGLFEFTKDANYRPS
jgi:SAM-dependent methyltransferase